MIAQRDLPHGTDTKDKLRLWLRLLKTTNGIETELRRRLRDGYATTLPRFDVMSALARHPEGLRMSELSDFLRVSNGNITGIVDRLSDDGFARRAPVQGDRRAQLARLTAAGQAEFNRLAIAHENWIGDLLGSLGPDETDRMMTLLDEIQPENRDGDM